MSNEVVKYDNKMNSFSFRNFTAIEFDLLMTVCSRMREKGVDTVTYSFDKLRALSKYDPQKSTGRFVKDIIRSYKKLINIPIRIDKDGKIIYFVLFTRFEVDPNQETVEIRVNDEFTWVLNNLTSRFTRFELDEFLGLKSKYAKDIYRFCKQFRATGFWRVEIANFREMLDVPNSYSMGSIDKYIINPAIEELRNICTYFEVKKEYAKTSKRGRKSVIALQFYFEFKNKDDLDFNQIDFETFQDKNMERVDEERYVAKSQSKAKAKSKGQTNFAQRNLSFAENESQLNQLIEGLKIDD